MELDDILNEFEANYVVCIHCISIIIIIIIIILI